TQMGTFALVPQVVQAVKVPVVAAGGIADAQGIAAALALGAAGVQLGTAFLLTPESTITAVHRKALQTAQGRPTALTNLYSGRPARGLKNRLMRELGPISPLAPAFPAASAALAPLRAAAEHRDDDGFSPLWCGQNLSGCLAISCAELISRLIPQST
ncbi:MAG TPA: nitronate monooxygenase, partial [Aquabacterium sp.]|nr:nitronate monooxygenase [Aquabacterium sp.]